MKARILALFICGIITSVMIFLSVPTTGSKAINADTYLTTESEDEIQHETLVSSDSEAESLSNKVDSTTETYSTNENSTPPVTESEETDKLIKSLDFSAADADMLLRIGMCEAGGESVECIANVMLVVLNRAWSDDFPDTIEKVLYQKGQFTPVDTGWFEVVEPSDKCIEALKMISNGWDESQNTLYFESCKGESWHSRNLNFLFRCDGVNFYN